VIAVSCAATFGCTDVMDDTGVAEQSLGGAPVGLAVEVDNGAGIALQLKRGQTYYLNQIDMRASITATTEEGVAGLRTQGDFASLPWLGIHQDDQEFILLSNADGTFTRRRFFRDALWMNLPSFYVLEQLDAKGHRIGESVFANAGVDAFRTEADDFFDRRFRAIQWTKDCHTSTDCTGATNFEEEALVELRYGKHPTRTFTLAPTTASLRLTWSLRPGHPYDIPVTQIDNPPFAYGFNIAVHPVTAPRADGTYAPGSDITFKVQLQDGQGNPLHGDGALPSYNDVEFGANPAGIQYYRAFFDPTTTYWRRKHRERMMMAEFLGPAQNAQPIRTIIDLDKFLNEDDVQVTGTLEVDGVHSEFHTFPTARDLFGGAFDPVHAGWANPVPDTWTHHIPENAPAGTYFMNMKGRRTYMGEDVPFTRTLEIQVGTPTRTTATLNTGPCASCHTGESALNKVLHANDNRGTCAGCHVPLGFELEGPIYVRTHFIHSRSRRFDAPLDKCASCHLTKESIQRTSKSACLSCHKSYPADHVQAYGPVESMYVGGGRESFQQCTTTCHLTHPNSQL
ncbi:MAG TPA: hypothetical protein VFV99_33300, partial [Kofleriaceae bacterium]|nr:hypothetical protein [Kofleriaceae bacterium]